MNTSIGVHRFSPTQADRETDLAQLYDHEAPHWDGTIERLGFPTKYREILDQELDDTPVREPRRLLDVGTGTGELGMAVAENLIARGATSIEAVGVDLSEEMLRIAHQKFESIATPFTGIRSNIESIPVPSNSFDFVVSAHAIEHTERPLKVMSEMERVLAPGGTLVIMMTRCNPITLNIQRQWSVQCARSQKLSTVVRDFGLRDVRWPRYPNSLVCNWLSFCCISRKPEASQ